MKQNKKDKIQGSQQQLSIDFNIASQHDDNVLQLNDRKEDLEIQKKARVIPFLNQFASEESIFSSILQRRID